MLQKKGKKKSQYGPSYPGQVGCSSPSVVFEVALSQAAHREGFSAQAFWASPWGQRMRGRSAGLSDLVCHVDNALVWAVHCVHIGGILCRQQASSRAHRPSRGPEAHAPQ